MHLLWFILYHIKHIEHIVYHFCEFYITHDSQRPYFFRYDFSTDPIVIT